MNDEQIAEAAFAYASSAYASMARELPGDIDLALGTCLHWAQAGKVMGIQEWMSEMYGQQQAQEQGPSNDDILQFKIFAPDGTVRPLRVG